MVISDKLALEIFTIELAHLVAVLAASVCAIFFWLKAKHSPLLYSFLCLVGTLMLWMLAKIFKTVSPNESLRWVFIVVQYLGVEFSGYFLVVFALYYTGWRKLRKRSLLLLSVPPSAVFLIVLTNPLHMKFYSYFDFYKDSFGPLFFPAQGVLYLYLLTGVILLSLGFSSQPQFRKRKMTARLFAVAILVPIGFNTYYLLVKLTDIPWILDIPFFDFTPITSTAALILFVLPAFRYRFLDLIPYAGRIVFDQHPDGLAVMEKEKITSVRNNSFQNFVSDPAILTWINENRNKVSYDGTLELATRSGKICHVSWIPLNKDRQMLHVRDVSRQAGLEKELKKVNDTLMCSNLRLMEMRRRIREFTAAKIKTRVAQDVHDIFGHTLIVVLGLIDLSVQEPAGAAPRLAQAKELLRSGVLDLRLALEGQDVPIKTPARKTTLEKYIQSLSNEAIEIDFSVQGDAVELDSNATDALSRVCREAVTNAIRHGRASLVTIILRFKKEELELYIIDNGTGCSHIAKSFGLTGMENRVLSLGGSISFGSDGEKGFHIHLTIPIVR